MAHFKILYIILLDYINVYTTLMSQLIKMGLILISLLVNLPLGIKLYLNLHFFCGFYFVILISNVAHNLNYPTNAVE